MIFAFPCNESMSSCSLNIGDKNQSPLMFNCPAIEMCDCFVNTLERTLIFMPLNSFDIQ